MKLIHYASAPVLRIFEPEAPQKVGRKPQGLWVSDDADEESNWRTWCEGEGFRLECLTHSHEIELATDANLLVMRSSYELTAFSNCYGRVPHWCRGLSIERREIDWTMVASEYQGIVITPYIWSCRLDGPASEWYYGWDCASGCIWEPAAVNRIHLREVRDVLEVRGDPFKPEYPKMLGRFEYDIGAR